MLGVCGSTRTRGCTRPDPYPRVRVGSGRCLTGRVGSGTTSTGMGIPGFTRKERDFSKFWSENLFISACFLNYLSWSNCIMARENSTTPCPEKNGTNNILGITLTKFIKFSQFLAQFMLTCLLTKKLQKVPSLPAQHYVIMTGTFSSRIVRMHIELEQPWSSWKEKRHSSFRRNCGLQIRQI